MSAPIEEAYLNLKVKLGYFKSIFFTFFFKSKQFYMISLKITSK